MKYFLLTFFLCTTIFLPAQEEKTETIKKYNEYGGLNLGGILGMQLGDHPGDINTQNFTLGVFPRYTLVAPNDWFGISVGSPLQLGLDIRSSTSGSLVSFAADLPAVADINFGSQANPYSEFYVGAFIGAGIDYNLTYFSVNDQKLSSHSFGPIVHGGLRWIYNDRPMGLRIAYMWGLVNNLEKDPAIIYEGNTYPSFLSFNLTYAFL
jgi:hypothetical protein